MRLTYKRIKEINTALKKANYNYESYDKKDLVEKVRGTLITYNQILENAPQLELTEEEKHVFDYIDNEKIFGDGGAKLIEKNMKVLDSYSKSSDSRYSNSASKRNIALLVNIFTEEKLKRILGFLENELDQNLSWTNGLEIKLNTTHHINSIEILSNELTQWLKVLRTFGRLSNSNESDFDIHHLKTGSLLITVTTVAGIVITIGQAINYVLDAVKKSYEIKKHAIELEKLKSDGLNKITNELTEASKIDSKTESGKIAEKLILEIKYEGDDINEVKTALKMAIGYLLKFFDEGGETRLLLAPNLEIDKKNAQIKKELNIKQDALIEGQKEVKKLMGGDDIKLIM